jgi:biotin-(acetyl-CoA carboxylase) ligase
LVESVNNEDQFFVVIGVGINLKLNALEEHWGDLSLTLTEKERLKFIKFVSERLSKINNDNFLNDWKEKWEEKCFHLNQEILVLPDKKKAVFLCIDDSGRMVAQVNGERKVFSSSEVKIRNAY